MRFGRVEGVVVPVAADRGGGLQLTVYLETGRRLEIVREETVPVLRPIAEPADLVWHADQYTQETIAVDLAELGWEVIGAGDLPVPAAGELVRSAGYAVRNLNPGGS
jgi:hypothetical protein